MTAAEIGHLRFNEELRKQSAMNISVKPGEVFNSLLANADPEVKAKVNKDDAYNIIRYKRGTL